MAGARPDGERVVLYDDDHYYMGGVLAELLAREGREVTLVTPAARVSEWTVNTMEQDRIQRRLIELGVDILTTHALASAEPGAAVASCVYSGRERELACDALVLVTARDPVGTRPVACVELAGELGRGRGAAACARSATPGARAPSRPPSGTAAATPRSSTSRIR